MIKIRYLDEIAEDGFLGRAITKEYLYSLEQSTRARDPAVAACAADGGQPPSPLNSLPPSKSHDHVELLLGPADRVAGKPSIIEGMSSGNAGHKPTY